MKNIKEINTADKKQQYDTPILQNLGAVIQLTAGTVGSDKDVSDPFTSQPK